MLMFSPAAVIIMYDHSGCQLSDAVCANRSQAMGGQKASARAKLDGSLMLMLKGKNVF